MLIAARNAMLAGGGGGDTPAYWGLYFEAEEANVVVNMGYQSYYSFNSISLQYSIDGVNWQTFDTTGGSTPVTLAEIGDRVYFQATTTNSRTGLVSGGDHKGHWFTLSGHAGAHGNIMSLLDGTNENNTTLTTEYAFCYLFKNCTSLTTAPDLPAATLSADCYYYMFFNCTSLTTAPALPATTLSNYCYSRMFAGCRALVEAPALPSQVMARGCYSGMFDGCSSLTAAPALPAMALATNCYYQMFYDCTSLTTAPALPATTLVSGCYENMYYRCENLQSITVAFTTWMSSATSWWIYGVPATGTFTCPAALGTNDTITRGNSNCPSGWTVVNT